MKSEQLNSFLEVKQVTNKDAKQSGYIASDRYIAESTAGQTIITLPFTIAQTTEAKNSFLLVIGGKLFTEGALADYLFTNVMGGVSSQITLNVPLLVGYNIQALKLGAYREYVPNASSIQASVNGLINDAAAAAAAAATAATNTALLNAVTPQVLTSIANTISISMATYDNFSHAMNENTTLANPTGAIPGHSGMIAFTQAAVAKTLAFGTNYKFTDGLVPTMSVTPGAIAVLSYQVINSNFIACSFYRFGVL